MNFKRFSTSDNQWHDTPHYIHNTSTDTLTTLPAEIYANDTTATVGLKGDMAQSSQPSPTSPVTPQGTGERTGNLFDKSKRTDNSRVVYTTGEIGALYGVFVSDFTPIEPNATYTLNIVSSISGKTGHLFALYDENKNFVNTGAHEASSATVVYTFTTPSNVAYIRFNGNMSSVDEIMLNTGSTPLPYEPYGYKIPISSANTTTPVYLGEVRTTRKIGKLVLTGNENWVSKGNPATFRYENSPISHALNSVCYCSHFKNLPWVQVQKTNNSFVVWYTSIENTINIRCEDYSTVEDFKAFLSAQYQNGTPVIIWYVLEEPTTGIVNEPLRKIGDYADEVSGITIPTTAGANTLSVDTTLQPSEVSVNYKGWHPVQSVHERENGAWT